jgi:hypothetical protein
LVYLAKTLERRSSNKMAITELLANLNITEQIQVVRNLLGYPKIPDGIGCLSATWGRGGSMWGSKFDIHDTNLELVVEYTLRERK